MPFQRNVAAVNGLNTLNWMSPMKMFEYMQSGKPIISSDFPVLREILEHNENALLVESDNIEMWIKAIDLLGSKDLRFRLARNAFISSSRNFTWDKRITKIIDFLKM